MKSKSLPHPNRALDLVRAATVYAVLVLAVAAPCAPAQPPTNTASATNAPEMAVLHGPLIQAPSDTEITITWATTQRAVSWVEFRADGEAAWQTNWPAKHGLIDADKTWHRVSLTGLKPGASYRYRAVSRAITTFKSYEVKFGATVASSENRFTTLDAGKSTVSFVVVNDRHENADGLRASWKTVDWKQVNLAFLNGDMVHAVQGEPQLFRTIIDPCAEVFGATIPLVLVRGNHETRGPLARRLLDYFPTRSGSYYYTIRHGPVSFLVLDCGEDKADANEEYFGLTAFRPYMRQHAEWLAREIQSPAFQEAQFRVCLLHIPPSSAENPKFIQSRWLWENVVPLLNQGKVDLMLSGHTHRDAVSPAGTDGIHFPVIICGPQTVIRCDATRESLRISRSDLAGTSFPEIPPIKARSHNDNQSRRINSQ